jgi:hypothetical protein
MKETTIGCCKRAKMHQNNLSKQYDKHSNSLNLSAIVLKYSRNIIRLKRIYKFWCSMLVYTPFALCFVYTLWRFYAFSRTNLLTRCHSASSYFLLFLCFRKVTQEIFSELDETKAEVPNYLTQRRSPKESWRRTKGQPDQVVARATPRLRHQVVWPPSPPPDIALSPIYSPQRENPKGPNSFPENIL